MATVSGGSWPPPTIEATIAARCVLHVLALGSPADAALGCRVMHGGREVMAVAEARLYITRRREVVCDGRSAAHLYGARGRRRARRDVKGEQSMSTENEYGGRCFCGSVALRVVGKPVAMGYCHCSSCREWSAGPVNAFTLWAPSAVTITRGADQIGEYHKTDNSVRKWCKACGGHLLTEHPSWQLVDVYSAVLADLPFEPGVHVNYSETVLRIHDGLPKLKDFPKELGGSGSAVPE